MSGAGRRETHDRVGRLSWRRLRCGVGLLLVLGAVEPQHAEAQPFAAECTPPTDVPSLTVGAVDCLRLPSPLLGAVTAFSYYIPPACDPSLGRRCPVLYYLHGTGGSYQTGTGPKGRPSALIRALSSGPPVNPSAVADPWTFADPEGWVPLEPLDMIVVAPHGRTLPGGYGPAEGLDTAFTDWNPRYAKGGDGERYSTPPPRFESHLVQELLPYVDHHFPTVGSREWRAVIGNSLGGYGAFSLAFRHPDLFASVGAISGAVSNFAHPTFDVQAPLPVSLAPPTALPYTRLPGAVPSVVPDQLFGVTYVALATVGWGDQVGDHVWWRGHNPAELATNVTASAGGEQSLHIRYFVNDMVPRRPEDFQSQSYYVCQGFEVLVFPTNAYLHGVLERLRVEHEFQVNPGLHCSVYWNPFLRQQLAAQYARLRHWDGSGSPPPRPARFDYRTTQTAFSVWDWDVRVEREASEFLNLTDVTCQGLTLRGTGRVTVTVPRACATGLEGSRTFTVDLGPSQPTDEPLGLGSTSAWGRTVHVQLAPLP